MRIAALALMAGLVGCSLTTSGTGGECLVRSSLRSVTIKWTVNGVAADLSSCTAHPDLYVQFDGADYGDTLRFAPVPCREGSFFVDKLPKRYVQAELGSEGGAGDVSAIDATTAQAKFDLFQ